MSWRQQGTRPSRVAVPTTQPGLSRTTARSRGTPACPGGVTSGVPAAPARRPGPAPPLGVILQQVPCPRQEHPSSASVCTEASCLTIRCRPGGPSAICTAAAPDEVRTRRMNPTPRL